MLDLAGRHVGSRGQEIVLKRRRQRLCSIVVVHALEQGVANAVRDAALHLAIDDQGIDDISAVMRDRIFEDRNTARDGIDFDLGDMRSVAVRGLRRREVSRVLQPGGLPGLEGNARYALGNARKLA